MNRLSVWWKNSEEREEKGGETACRQTFEAAIPPSCNYPADHLSVRSLPVNRFGGWVTPPVFAPSENRVKWRASVSVDFAKIHWSLVRELIQCRSLAFQGNKNLLVDSGQDSVVLVQAFESLRFPLEQEESFSDSSCLTCAQQAVRLASSVSTLTSPCNERTWNAKGTDTIMTSPERESWSTKNKYKKISSALIADRNYTFGYL